MTAAMFLRCVFGWLFWGHVCLPCIFPEQLRPSLHRNSQRGGPDDGRHVPQVCVCGGAIFRPLDMLREKPAEQKSHISVFRNARFKTLKSACYLNACASMLFLRSPALLLYYSLLKYYVCLVLTLQGCSRHLHKACNQFCP